MKNNLQSITIVTYQILVRSMYTSYFKRYAELMKSLMTKDCRYLLETHEYDETKIEGIQVKRCSFKSLLSLNFSISNKVKTTENLMIFQARLSLYQSRISKNCLVSVCMFF